MYMYIQLLVPVGKTSREMFKKQKRTLKEIIVSNEYSCAEKHKAGADNKQSK